MRLAAFSDIHGNPIALDAVLADIQAAGGVDGFLVVGDLCALGYDPLSVLERLAALPDTIFVRGNTDRYTASGERPIPTLDDARRDPSLIPQLVDVAHSFAWTQGYLTPTRWLDWLAGLPLEHRQTLPDGARLLAVHASPGLDDGDGISPTQTDDELRALLAGCGADLVLVGHTHWALDRQVDGVRVVNLGSVSNPFWPDLRASYALIDADESGFTLDLRRVDYDHAAVIEAVRRARHPAGEYITGFQEGRRRKPWQDGGQPLTQA